MAAVCVDDLIILAKALETMNAAKHMLAERFKMKDLVKFTTASVLQLSGMVTVHL